MSTATPTASTWPIATCMHGFARQTDDGVPLHDAPGSAWDAVLAQVARAGFDLMELADSHIRPADLDPGRQEELLAVAASHGAGIPVVHLQRRSVIQPGHEADNLAYAHRTIDAAAAMGMTVFSTGLHQPFSDAQRKALWFWTAPGPRDPDDPATWRRAVLALRELGRHAADVGLTMSLEIYEDTYLGSAEQAIRLVEEIGLPNVGLNPDIANVIRLHRPVEDWREAYRRTLPYANYWHLKNYSRDEAWDGSWATSAPTTMEAGLIDYRDVMRMALDAGYRGILLMEQYGGDSLGVCATNRTYVRSLLPDG